MAWSCATLVVGLTLAGFVTAAHAALAPGDPARGRILYGACSGCHSIDSDEIGPRHRGVVGRRAGSVAGFPYSPALAHLGVVWTPQNLDRWLSGPQVMAPGARMAFSIADPQKRADIIAYLATQQ